jgi:hypothetical protein
VGLISIGLLYQIWYWEQEVIRKVLGEMMLENDWGKGLKREEIRPEGRIYKLFPIWFQNGGICKIRISLQIGMICEVLRIY